ncbi:MAG: patatin-like phospholipase family protein [Bacteroidales bacterium]
MRFRTPYKRRIIILLLACFFALLPDLSSAQSRPKVALVLSGGGAAGLAHIGVIRVLEEVGIPVDYVAGTSMGSIVGAMYAMGMNSHEMKQLVLEMDWESVLTDAVPRSDLSFEYKGELEKYFYDFPITKEGVHLPAGLVAGTNITNMLAGLTWPAYNIRNFNQLPRPYLCIGADIVKGEQVILSTGVLHDALRASMAIPTAFTPVELHGKLLVDGGFINNFPAEEAKNMGADIIIGVDVQRDLYEKNELKSVVSIMKQISSLTREDVNIRNRELCDILIRPRTPGASTMSFGMADEIMRDGERIARGHFSELKKLADQLNRYPGQTKPVQPLPKVDSVYVKEMVFTGLEHVSPDYVKLKMNLPFPAWLTPKDIYRALQRVYGTNEFVKVTYQLDPVIDGVRLTVRTEEKEQNLVHIGAHFDNLFNASLLARANFKNTWKKGDQLSIDLNLGENPHLRSSYYFLFKDKNQYGLAAEFNRIYAYDYLDGRRIRSYIYRDLLVEFLLRTTWREIYASDFGIQSELAWFSPNVSDWEIDAFNSRMINIYGQLRLDNFNRVPYPTSGQKAELTVRGVNSFISGKIHPALILDMRYRQAIPLSEKFSLQPSLMAGFAFGDTIPYPYRTYLGGLGYYHKSLIPFVGSEYMERASNHAIVLRTDLQYRFRNNHYFTLKCNVAKAFDSFDKFLDPKTSLAGMGLTYGYSSPVGPLELTLMGSTGSKKPIIFINLGYWIR